MNVGSVGYSQHGYTRPTSIDQEGKANQMKASEDAKQPYQPIAKDALKGKAVNETTKTEGNATSAGVEAFTYGALGMDHPDEVKSNDDGAYKAGQVLSALGTLGTILAIVV